MACNSNEQRSDQEMLAYQAQLEARAVAFQKALDEINAELERVLSLSAA